LLTSFKNLNQLLFAEGNGYFCGFNLPNEYPHDFK